MTALTEFSVRAADGRPVPLSTWTGKVLLIVNTASRCGFTPQYEGLEALRRRYADRGFEVLAFPCNQFGGQEPGTDEEISSFCELNHGVTFPLMKKSDVNGNNTNDVRSSEYCLHSI